MAKKVIMLILDGFSSTYLKMELCPNLCELAASHYLSKLKPMFGFQGVGAAMYSGASSNITGIFTEFIREKNDLISKSRFLKSLLKLSDMVPNDDLCLNSRALLFKLVKHRTSGVSNIIPSKIVGEFSPKLRKSFTKNGSLGKIPTIFDILDKNEMSYELQKPSPRLERTAINNTINRAKNSALPHLTVIHPCSLDITGHNFGPRSSQIEKAVASMDEQIGFLIRSIESAPDEIMVLILSDHGMSPVYDCLNLDGLLKQLPLKLREDYLVFLDSTIARFWFFKNNAKELISNKLSTVNSGRVLDLQDKKELGIEKIGVDYGELIFAVNEGTVIFPDFFRKCTPPKGMHGYALPLYDTPILALHHPDKVKPTRQTMPRFVDIMPTILEFFDLTKPTSCEGESLLR